MEKKLGDVSKISSGGTPNRGNTSYWNGNIPWITTSLIDFTLIHSAKEMITQQGLKNSSAKLFPPDTLLMAMYGQGKTRGQVALLGIEACTNQACAAIISDSKIISSHFLFQNLSKRYDEIRELSNQGGQENLSASIIKGINVTFPSLSEQIKIANFLSILDQRIQTQSKIIEELETLIKETFKKHYQNAEKKEYLISDLGEQFSTMNLSKADLSNDGNECILYGELFTIYGCVIDKVRSFTKRNAPKTSLSEENDLLFPSSTTVNALSLITPSAITQKGVILGGDMFGIHLKKEFNNEYLSYAINYLYKDALAKYAQGSTIIHLYYSDIKKFKILLPSLEHQKVLASLLRLIRDKTTLERQSLELLIQLKQYMLKNLFI